MTRRNILVVLLALMLVLGLSACQNTSTNEDEPSPGQEEVQEVYEVRYSASMLQFYNLDLDEALQSYEENPDIAISARAEGNDFVLEFTPEQLESYRADTESTLDEYKTSLEESEDVTSVEVSDDYASVTVVASPNILDKPVLIGEAFAAVPGMCVSLQAINGVSDWHVDLTVIDAETNKEVLHVTLPEESANLTAESWASAVAQG